MCGPDHPAPSENYSTHASIRASLDDDNFVTESFPVKFKTPDTGEEYTYQSFIAYRKDYAAPRPLVMVMPNYAGLKQFDKDQAVFLAKLGYVGLAVDQYVVSDGYTYEDRNPKVAATSDEKPEHKSKFSRDVQSVAGDYVNQCDVKLWEYAMKMSQPGFDAAKEPMTVAQSQGFAHFKVALGLMNVALRAKGHMRSLMAETLRLAREHPAVHKDLAGAIGYCFGGMSCLEMVRMGLDLKCVCSFHGILQSNPLNAFQEADFDDKVDMTGVVDAHTKGCRVLIENAEHDVHVTNDTISKFTDEMNKAGVNWQIHHHSGVKHGWTLPPGVWASEYDEVGDIRSTTNMVQLFRESFPDHPPRPVPLNAAGAPLNIPVDVRFLDA